MKVEIYQDQKAKVEPVLRLRLEETGAAVALVAVDEFGAHVAAPYILEVGANGVVALQGGVNSAIGLEIDEDGYVKVERA